MKIWQKTANNFGAAIIDKSPNRSFVEITDRNLAMKGVKVLLGFLQVIKGSGNRELLDAVFDNYVNSAQILDEFFGPIDASGKRQAGLRHQLRQRASKLNVVNYKAYVSPTLNRSGNGPAGNVEVSR